MMTCLWLQTGTGYYFIIIQLIVAENQQTKILVKVRDDATTSCLSIGHVGLTKSYMCKDFHWKIMFGYGKGILLPKVNSKLR